MDVPSVPAITTTASTMKPNQVILYVLVLACAYFGFNPDWGYMSDSPWWTHLTFHFAHGNIFHLAVNMLVVFLLLPYPSSPSHKSYHWLLWPLSYFIATACSFLISTPKPTVGLSGMLFAYYGIIFLKDGPQWKPLLHTIIYMAVSCLFVTRMAVGLHFICLFMGALAGGIISLHNNIENKIEKYD